jgi:tetratricopeptide (TPR) repeat protein
MALANQSKLSDAKTELDVLEQLLKDSVLLSPFTPFSPSIDGATIAQRILAGTIALKEKRYENAIEHFKAAVLIEDNMVYNEPRDWMLNTRHYLGNAYIKAGKLADAKATLLKDMAYNNENGWSLFGLWQTLTAEKKTAEAAKMLVRFKKAFDKSDVKLYGPVF